MNSAALTEQLRSIAHEVSNSLSEAESISSADDLQHAVDAAMYHCLDQLNSTGLVGPANRIPSTEFWTVAKSVLERGALQLHAREKPRGYAGDFQLLDHICQNRLPGKSRHPDSSDAGSDVIPTATPTATLDPSPDPLGNAMDAFFQAQAAPCAVRNRYRDIADQIVKRSADRPNGHPLRILSFGSGPGQEICWSMDKMSAGQIENLDVTLLDIDPLALEFCRGKICPSEAGMADAPTPLPSLTTTRVNLGRFPRLKKLHATLGKFDFVYCAGLFDYLPEDQFVEHLKTLWNLVDDKGTLLAFNFSDDNSSRPYMEWIGNWYLLHRSAEQLRNLAQQANLDGCHSTIQSEAEGVNLFLRCQRT